LLCIAPAGLKVTHLTRRFKHFGASRVVEFPQSADMKPQRDSAPFLDLCV